MIASSGVAILSAISVSRRDGPTFRSSMKRTLNSLMPRLRSSSSFSSVISSFTRGGPRRWPRRRRRRRRLPMTSSVLDGERPIFASSSFLIAACVNLRFFLTMTSPSWVLDVARGALALEQVGVDRLLVLPLPFAGFSCVVVLRIVLGAVEVDWVPSCVSGSAERAQEHGRRELPAAVDAHVEDVLVVELEVDPRAAVRDDAGVEEELARRWLLPLSWSKKAPGERWSWLTTTRSVPLMMNVPFSVMSGISPK